MMKKILVLWLLTTLGNSIASSKERFPVEGVYITFDSFRFGKPELLKSDLFRDSQCKQPVSSLKQWFSAADMYYRTDSLGISNLVDTPIWGYVENEVIYILLNGKFHKILLFGQISYFKESYPIVKDHMSPVVTDARSSTSYRLMDMNTGKVVPYSPSQLEAMLRSDEELFSSFKALSSPKVKERQMYSFIERFNKRHPLQKQSDIK